MSVWQRLQDRSTLAHMGVGTVATWAPCMGAREATMLVSLEKPVGFQARAETQTPAPLCPFRRPGSPFCVAPPRAVPQSSLCGGAAGLAPVSRRLQDTVGPLRCPRAAGWGSPVARGRGAQWPCGGQATPVCLSLHGPCLSRHTRLKGVRGVRTGDERPAPRWGFGVGGVLGRGPRETGRAAFKCFGSQSRATWPKS